MCCWNRSVTKTNDSWCWWHIYSSVHREDATHLSALVTTATATTATMSIIQHFHWRKTHICHEVAKKNIFRSFSFGIQNIQLRNFKFFWRKNEQFCNCCYCCRFGEISRSCENGSVLFFVTGQLWNLKVMKRDWITTVLLLLIVLLKVCRDFHSGN